MTKLKMIALLASLLSLGTAIAHAETKVDKMADDTFANDGKSSDKVKIAECNDGKTMYGTDPHKHQGACRGHGGVKAWADGSPVRSKAGKTTEYR